MSIRVVHFWSDKSYRIVRQSQGLVPQVVVVLAVVGLPEALAVAPMVVEVAALTPVLPPVVAAVVDRSTSPTFVLSFPD